MPTQTRPHYLRRCANTGYKPSFAFVDRAPFAWLPYCWWSWPYCLVLIFHNENTGWHRQNSQTNMQRWLRAILASAGFRTTKDWARPSANSCLPKHHPFPPPTDQRQPAKSKTLFNCLIIHNLRCRYWCYYWSSNNPTMRFSGSWTMNDARRNETCYTDICC